MTKKELYKLNTLQRPIEADTHSTVHQHQGAGSTITVLSRASKSLCLQGLFKIMGFTKVLPWREAFKPSKSVIPVLVTGKLESR